VRFLQMNLLGSEGMVDRVLQNLRACQEIDLSTREKLLDVTAYNTAINACAQANKVRCYISEGGSLPFVPYCFYLSSYAGLSLVDRILVLSTTYMDHVCFCSLTRPGIYSWK